MNLNLSDIHAPIHDWLGFDLTEQQIKEFADRHPSWAGDVSENGMDTCNREWFASLFARELIGRNWPMTMDAHKDPNFLEDLRKAASEAGYKLV
jgi:hypothetical protein